MPDSYLKTLRTLLIQPRAVVDGFINNSENRFLHPLKFCLVGAAAIILLNTLFIDFTIRPQLDPQITTESEQIQRMTEWIQITSVRAFTQFLPLTMILFFIVPLSLAGLFFLREYIDGFYSGLILNTYAVGVAQLFLLLLIPVWKWVDIPLTDSFMNTTLPAVVTAGGILWIYFKYFQTSSFMKWLRVLSSYTAGYVLFVLLGGFAASVVGYVIYAGNRILELWG
ncbi:MAG: hypothetical protein WD604_08585 [Balneolaceae bacterium]